MINITLSYVLPEYLDDERAETEYVENVAELMEQISSEAVKFFETNVFYKVIRLNPENTSVFCSSNTPRLSLIADVSEQEDSLEDMVEEFQSTSLTLMRAFLPKGEFALSWWRLFPTGSLLGSGSR